MEDARKRCLAPTTSKFSSASEEDPYKIDPIIALIDMDCFYVQVELRLEPEWRGKPACVVQYKTRHKGGGIIALSYEAREKGVKRFHHADEAREVCPDVKVFVVPELHGKADLTRYREAGAEVIRVMKRHFHCVERASIDEAFIDLTKEVKTLLPRYLSKELMLTPELLGSTCVAESRSVEAWLDQLYLMLEEDPGAFVASSAYLNNFALAIGATLVNNLRQDILKVTQFHCSGGISYSKTLSKLACGLNKPRKQTVLPGNAVGPLFSKTNIIDVRMLGGKLGRSIIENLCISTMGELCKVELPKLRQYFGEETARWLASLAVGIDNEPVQERDLPKSIGCSKNFLGKEALFTREQVKRWMEHFVSELSVRLRKDQAASNRSASLLTVSITYVKDPFKIKSGQSCSRCAPMNSYEKENMVYDAFMVADRLLTSLGYRNGRYHFAVINLGISASKMRDGGFTASRIDSYFRDRKKKVEEEDPEVFPGNKYSELKVKGREPREPSKAQPIKSKEQKEGKDSIAKFFDQERNRDSGKKEIEKSNKPPATEKELRRPEEPSEPTEPMSDDIVEWGNWGELPIPVENDQDEVRHDDGEWERYEDFFARQSPLNQEQPDQDADEEGEEEFPSNQLVLVEREKSRRSLSAMLDSPKKAMEDGERETRMDVESEEEFPSNQLVLVERERGRRSFTELNDCENVPKEEEPNPSTSRGSEEPTTSAEKKVLKFPVGNPNKEPSDGDTGNDEFDLFHCERCLKLIWCRPMWRDHSDFHMAEDLNKALNASQEKKPRKRLRLDDPPITRTKKTNFITLDRFLVKKPKPSEK